MAIQFYLKGVDFSWTKANMFSSWIRKTIELEKPDVLIGEITIVFCSDEYLLDINRRYLDHDYYTDIITFPFDDNPLSAELYISIDRVRENAEGLDIGFLEELARVVIHGILHLCGYEDYNEKNSLEMRSREDFHLSSLLPLEA